MSVVLFNTKIEEYFKSTGHAVTHQDIRKWLTAVQKQTSLDNHLPLSQINEIDMNTSCKYKTIYMCSNKRKFRSKVQQKTENMYIAENSVLSTVAYLFTVTTSHFLIGLPLETPSQ